MTTIIPTAVDRLRAAADLLEQCPPTGTVGVSTNADAPGYHAEAYSSVGISGHPASIRALLAHVDTHKSTDTWTHDGHVFTQHACTFEGVRLTLTEVDDVTDVAA